MNSGLRFIVLGIIGTALAGSLAAGCKKDVQEPVVPPGTKIDPERAAKEAAMPTPDIRQPKGQGKIQPPRLLEEKK